MVQATQERQGLHVLLTCVLDLSQLLWCGDLLLDALMGPLLIEVGHIGVQGAAKMGVFA